MLAAGDAAFAEREAYSWFNRLMALRYMEIHGLLPWGGRALSAADGSFDPELATRAADLPLASLDRAAYLERAAESDDEGAFRLALEAACAELADLPLANLDRAAYQERAAESDDEGPFRLALEAACA